MEEKTEFRPPMVAGERYDWRVTVPEGGSGDWSVRRFFIEENSLERLRLIICGRDCGTGEFTRLVRRGKTGKHYEVWMSDTRAEYVDHLEPIAKIRDRVNNDMGGRVLIHGLGLGVVLQSAVSSPGLDHVDVVELNEDVIALAGPHYEKMAADNNVSLTIHHDDAITKKWPRGSWWDIVWHDIWPTLDLDNRPQMTHLHRRFGQRSGWQGSWSKEELNRLEREGFLG